MKRHREKRVVVPASWVLALSLALLVAMAACPGGKAVAAGGEGSGWEKRRPVEPAVIWDLWALDGDTAWAVGMDGLGAVRAYLTTAAAFPGRVSPPRPTRRGITSI